jgi:hypothetical protein
MAYITIKTDTDGGLRTLHERVSCNDLDNQLFCEHLVERLRWAVEDTVPSPRDQAERGSGTAAGATLTSGILDALDQRRTEGM